MAKLSKARSRRSAGGADRSAATLALREVDERWGSLEELAAHVMLDRPELLEADSEAVGKALGLSVAAVRFLWFSSKDFAALLDWHVSTGAWGVAVRGEALRHMVGRMMSGEDKLGDVVKVAEYLDRKAGVAGGRGESGGNMVQIAFVQEGDTRSWVESHTPLRFGQSASSRQVAASGRSLSGFEAVELDEAE